MYRSWNAWNRIKKVCLCLSIAGTKSSTKCSPHASGRSWRCNRFPELTVTMKSDWPTMNVMDRRFVQSSLKSFPLFKHIVECLSRQQQQCLWMHQVFGHTKQPRGHRFYFFFCHVEVRMTYCIPFPLRSSRPVRLITEAEQGVFRSLINW